MLRRSWPLVAAFAVGLALRLLLLTTSIGSTDAAYVSLWGKVAVERGVAGAYGYSKLINHPPLSLWTMALATRIGGAIARPTYDVFRAFQIIADMITALLLMRLGRRIGRGDVPAILFLLTPAAMFVSGFHCNSDPTMVLFVVAAASSLASGNVIVAALCLAFAVNIKIVPLLLVPLFALGAGRRLPLFVAVFSVTAVALFLPAALTAGPVIVRNVFAYSGFAGEWGLPALLQILGLRAGAAWYAAQGKWLVAVAIGSVTLLPLVAGRKLEAPHVLAGVPLLMMLLLFLAPGFGMQYLLWPLPLLPLLLPRTAYIGVAGAISAYLFYAYTIWSDGFPWWFSNANTHYPGTREYILAGLGLWLIIGVVAVTAMRRFVDAPDEFARVPVN